VTPSDELERWVRTFETVDEDVRGQARDASAILRAAVPAPVPSALTHGDYRLGNMLSSGSTVRAVIDWEIWSVGDPRVDLAWFLMNADPDNPMATRTYPGMPKPEELRAEYQAAVGGEMRDLPWFEALTQFKLGSTVALILKHRRRSGRSQGRLAETVRSALERVHIVNG
jgi:aminoglycoside phosphotransferase (APT) family kinase protein